jgi:UDP-glucose 4-epimerase
MEKAYKRVLVTGGCGFLGRELIPQLIEKDYDVVVADDLSNPQSEVHSGYEFHQVDVGNQEKSLRAFQGADICIALASRRGAIGYVHENPTDIITNNNRIFNGTFELAVKAKIERIIFISSSMIFDSATQFPTKEEDVPHLTAPSSDFGFSKFIGEKYCHVFHRAYGLAYTIIRPSNIYGINELPGEKVGDSHVIPELFRKITSGQYPVEILGDGKQTRCFIHTSDMARGIVMALESENAINEDFNMGSTEEVSILDLARMIWDNCDMDLDFESSHKEGFPQDVRRQLMDTSKAKTLLGWQPQIGFQDGLVDVVTWLKGALEIE